MGKLLFQVINLVLRGMLNIYEAVSGAFHCADEFIQFEMHRFRIASLGVLNQEDHEESDDCGASVDDQLPGIREVKERAADDPNEYDKHAESERTGRPHFFGSNISKLAKPCIGFVLLSRL